MKAVMTRRRGTSFIYLRHALARGRHPRSAVSLHHGGATIPLACPERALRVFFFCLVLACPVPLLAQDDWPATGLDFGHLRSVALARCYDNPVELIGCYRAIAGALGVASDLRLTASELRAGEVPVKTFGMLNVVRSSEDDSLTSVYQFWQASIARRDRDIRNLQAHFRDTQAERIDFAGIVAFLRTVTPKEKEAELTARGINEYFAVVIDPHTQISTRRALADSMNGADSSFVGVGISVYKLGTRYLVTAVEANGPAQAQGVRVNDILTHIDGQSTRALSLEQLIASVRGRENSAVTLSLLRNGQSLQLVVPRRKLVREVVEARLARSDKRAHGYVRLRDFMHDQGCDKTAAAIRRLRAQGAQGWILDLRGNTGGSVAIAVCVAGLFLGPGELAAYRIDSESKHRQDYVTSSDQATRSPLAVLVDGVSASGSELLSGALQDNKRAWIVGEQTFGKGTAQSVHEFRIPGATGLTRNDTTGLFFLASGRTTQLQGITPDFVVPFQPDASEEERFTPREKDAYIAPIATSQDPWISPRLEEIRKVSACVEKNGQARSRFAASQVQADYQMLYAIDVLDCQ